jgi:glutamate-1-semialdehyde 2,1-aminomutase
MPITWQHLQRDHELFARELESFVPERVFDAHAHLWQAAWWDEQPAHVRAAPPEVDRAVYHQHMAWILPGRQVEAMHFAYPFPAPAGERLAAANAWVGAQLAAAPRACGQFLVAPGEWVREQVRALGMRGLKPFSFYAAVPDQWEAEIPDYLPPQLMAVAHEEGWSITLHLVRRRGIADASNQHWVRRYCEEYPAAQLILDHCARGFNPYHVMEAVPVLAGLGNLWLDTSAVCSPQAVLAALALVGPERLLYASDFYVSHMRAVNFPVGDSFMWLDEDSPLPAAPYQGGWELPLIGLENLRAVKAAFTTARLTDSQVAAYFRDNAARLVGRWGGE